MDFNGENKRKILDNVYDAKCYKDRIYYSAIKTGQKSGAAGNWETLKSVDINGKNEKIINNVSQCWSFVLYNYSGKDFLCIADDNILKQYSLDGKLIQEIKFQHINSMVEINNNIYLTDSSSEQSSLYVIDKQKLKYKKIANLTGKLINTNQQIFGELYEGAAGYSNKKWYLIDGDSYTKLNTN